jgi:protein LTV1
VPDLITSREDFDSMMDEFLDGYEILGRQMKPVLEGDTPGQKLDTIRRALAEGGPVRITSTANDDRDEILMPVDVDDVKDRWDCETILSAC